MTSGHDGGTAREAGEDFARLFDSLLYAASHDLKSPLLSMALGAELVAGAVGQSDERSQLAFEAMRHVAKDMERLLDAITLLSRARRRPLDDAPVGLARLLHGQLVVSDAELERVQVSVDARIMAELLEALGGGRPLEVQLTLGDDEVRLGLPLPEDAPEGCDGMPLELLLGALNVYAGTLVGTLAGLQVQLDRQGGALHLGRRRATVLLPLAAAGAGA